MKNKLSQFKKVALLDWFLVFCLAFLFYVPIANRTVWYEEERNRNDRRERMKTIVAAENFYYELTGEYTTDISELVFLVESTLDSLIKNPHFTGKQILNRNQIMLNANNPTLKVGDLIRVPYENYLINPFNDSECFIDIANGVWDEENFYDDNKNRIWDAAEEFVDEKNGYWDNEEEYVDGNGKCDGGEKFIDANDNGIWDSGDSYHDLNYNGKYDAPEQYIDSNENNRYDEAEVYSDCGLDGECEKLKALYIETEIDNLNWSGPDEGEGNGIYDKGEIFVDMKFDYKRSKSKEKTDNSMNGVWDSGEEFIDANDNGIWDSGDYYFDINGNEQYDEPEKFEDRKNSMYDEGEIFIDANDNSIWDKAEIYTDSNNNGKYDKGENYIDGNGSYDLGEIFTDSNMNGKWDHEEYYFDLNNNNQYDNPEVYIDSKDGQYNKGEEFSDGNNKYDIGEEFVDNKNGVWDEGEKFIDNKNGIWDEDEIFYDGNMKYDEGEEFIDGNGRYDKGEDFVDVGNGKYDKGEEFIDEVNGIWDKGEKFYDIANGQYDDWEDIKDFKNNKYDLGDLFSDKKNTFWDEGEIFIDRLNGVYDLGEDYIDLNDDGVWNKGEYFSDDLDGHYTSQSGFIPGEKFIDGNLKWDEGEDFIEGNGIFDGDDSCICILEEGELTIPQNCPDCYVDKKNNICDDDEEFIDEKNGNWDEGEEFVDLGNGRYDIGEKFSDQQDGVYNGGDKCICVIIDNVPEVPGRCPDCYFDSKNSIWDKDEEFLDGNGKYDVGEEFIDGDGIWNSNEEFIDDKNGIWDGDEIFIDEKGNEKYDVGEDFSDKKNSLHDPKYEMKGFIDFETQDCISSVMQITSIYKNVLTVRSYEKDQLDFDRNGLKDLNKKNSDIIHDVTLLNENSVKNITKELYQVEIPLGIETRLDTTFSSLVEVSKPVQDEIFEIQIPNEDNNKVRDKIWANRNNINNYDYINIMEQIVEDRIDIQKNYLLKKYRLKEDIIFCPIADDNKDKEFILEIAETPGSDVKQFVIKAPITKDDNEFKRGVRYIPGQAEVIIDGIPNWTN